MEHVSEFKYLGYVLDRLGIAGSEVQMLPSVVGRWGVGGKLLVLRSPWIMLGVCSLRVLYEALLVPVLLYGS